MKRKKLKSFKSLKKHAWDLMSRYVRIRDLGLGCITCGKKIPYNKAQGGHFVHRNHLDFNFRNINMQCVRCNFHLSGAPGEYAVALDKKYGIGTAESLLAMKNIIHKFSRTELEIIIEDLNNKIALLMTDKVMEVK